VSIIDKLLSMAEEPREGLRLARLLADNADLYKRAAALETTNEVLRRRVEDLAQSLKSISSRLHFVVAQVDAAVDTSCRRPSSPITDPDTDTPA